jgi:DNA-binding CsgD family transcriptional regulator/GAF domain-containing protein
VAEPHHVIAEASRALTTAEPHAEAILRGALEVLSRSRPAVWVASLMTSDPSVMNVVGPVHDDPGLNEYLDDGQRLFSSPLASIEVIESGNPLFLPSIPAPDFIHRYVGEAESGERRARRSATELGVLVLPMRAGGAIVGTLGMYVVDPSAEISEDDVTWVQVVADEAALAVELARLAEEARDRQRRLTALEDLAHAITSNQDLSVILDTVVDRIIAIVKVDACDLLVVDPGEDTFAPAASRGFRATAVGEFRLSMDNPLLNQALESRRVEYLRSAGLLDRARRRSVFAREGFVAYAAWPLISDGKLLGALEVFQRSDLALDMESSLFINCVADMGAVAIQMAGFHQSVLEQHPARRRGRTPDLSPTDMRVLQLVVEGLSNGEIGAQLHLSTNTIKFHMRGLLQKTGAANRTDLTRLAIREGWV